MIDPLSIALGSFWIIVILAIAAALFCIIHDTKKQ